MTSTDVMILVGFIIIFSAVIIQIRLSTKIFHLLKQQRHFETEIKIGSATETEMDPGLASVIEVEYQAETEVETEVQFHKNERLTTDFQDEIMTTVLLKMFTVRNSIHKQITNIHVKSIENAPKKVGIDEKILLHSFSKAKFELINLYWDLLNSYIQTYWTRKNGGFKTVFSGDIDKKTGEVGKMLVASEQLLLKLDKILEEFHRS